ncbi:MAG: hypothetical protein J4N26_03750 [Chloroflexi bacterium]|nr:hypothetical protein [Chloroflexota bacterium]
MGLRQTLRLIARRTALAISSGSAVIVLTLVLLTAAAIDPLFQHAALSETNATALAAEPAPAYVSELALPPRAPEALPASGAGNGSLGAEVNIVGVVLALLGAALVRGSLALRAT